MNLCIARPNKFTFSETFIENQIKGLNPQITLWEGWNPSILANGVSFLPFPFSIVFFRGVFRNLLPALYQKIYTRCLANFFVANSIDVLLANYGPMGAKLFNACKRANVKLFVHFHGFDASDEETLRDNISGYQNMFSIAKGIVVVSEDMKSKLVALGAPAEKLYLNPYGVDTARYHGATPELNSPIFISVGRFTEKKAPLLVIRAFNKVLAQIYNAKLIMIGEGVLMEQSRELASELGIQGNIDFQGVRTQDQIAFQLKSCKAFVQHSLVATNGDSEGTPNTILEASATGLPVVSTQHGGIKEAVVHNETGYLVKEGDWQAMADYMILLAKNPNLCREMGRKGKVHIEQNYLLDHRINCLKLILTQ